MKRLLEGSRYIVFFAIIGAIIAATFLFIIGLGGVIYHMYKGVANVHLFDQTNAKYLSVSLIQVIDIFLLATVLYITALGFYMLFIDDTLKLPKWLKFHTLDDLKNLLLSVVAVIISVTFLGELVTWKTGKDILWLGLGTALMLIAIAIYQYINAIKEK